jgi:hypothetical protein
MLGMMFDGEVTASEPVAVSGASVDAAAAVEISDRFVFTVGVNVDAPAAPGLARKLFGAGDSTDVDYRGSTAAELAALIAGRLHGILNERGLQSLDTPPRPFAPVTTAEPTSPDQTASIVHVRELGEIILTFSIYDRENAPDEEVVPALAEASAASS